MQVCFPLLPVGILFARTAVSSSFPSSSSTHRLFVGGLRRDATRTALRNVFEQYGVVSDIVSFRKRGYGFVQFQKSDGATAALAAPAPECGLYKTLRLFEERDVPPQEHSVPEGSAASFESAAVNLILQVAGSHADRVARYLEAGELAGSAGSCKVLENVPCTGKSPERLLLVRAADPVAATKQLARDPNVAFVISTTYVIAGVASNRALAAGLLAERIEDISANTTDLQAVLRVTAYPPSLQKDLLSEKLEGDLEGRLQETQMPSTVSFHPVEFTHLVSAVQTKYGVFYGVAPRDAFFGRPEKQTTYTHGGEQAEPVSRAFFKLAEAFRRRPDLKLPRNAVALDAGAAPGGWSQFLSGRVSRVVAVDPGDLLPPQADNVEHLKLMLEDAVPLLRERGERIDAYVSDMYLFDPTYQIDLLEIVHESGLLNPGAIVILTFKCADVTVHGTYSRRTNLYDRRVKEAVTRLEPLCEPGSMEVMHLFANKRMERTFIGRFLGTTQDPES